MARGVKGSGVTKAAKVEKVVPHDEAEPTVLTKTGFIKTLSPMKQQNGQKSTTLTINAHIYKFLPNEFGDYVTEVPFAEDYHAILSIGAGYQPYERPNAASSAPVAVSRIPTARPAPRVAAPAKAPRGPAKPNRPIHTQAQAPAVDPAAG